MDTGQHKEKNSKRKEKTETGDQRQRIEKEASMMQKTGIKTDSIVELKEETREREKERTWRGTVSAGLTPGVIYGKGLFLQKLYFTLLYHFEK